MKGETSSDLFMCMWAGAKARRGGKICAEVKCHFNFEGSVVLLLLTGNEGLTTGAV